MRAHLYAGIVLALASSRALADGMSLAGSLWLCTRAMDRSQFVITFYPSGGVGGGELQDGEVSPYVFDASRTKEGEWPVCNDNFSVRVASTTMTGFFVRA